MIRVEQACGSRPPPVGHYVVAQIEGSLGESRLGSPNTAVKQLASLGESRIGSPKAGGKQHRLVQGVDGGDRLLLEGYSIFGF